MTTDENDAITLSPGQRHLAETLPPLARRLRARLAEAPAGLPHLPVRRDELTARIGAELAQFEAWRDELQRVALGPLADALQPGGTRLCAEQGFAALQALCLSALEHWQRVARWADGQGPARDLVLLWRSLVRELAELIEAIVAALEHPRDAGKPIAPGRRQVELSFDFQAVAPLVARLKGLSDARGQMLIGLLLGLGLYDLFSGG